MLTLSAPQIRDALPWSALIDALRTMFRDGCQAPVRHAHPIAQPDAPEATLLLMPAWQEGNAATHYTGVKIVHVAPGNRAKGIPAVQAVYLLSDASTGVPCALLDGGELTDRRTAAASVLAGTYLARADSARLLIMGAGKIAHALAEAWCSHFPITDVMIWTRRPEAARDFAAELASHGIPARAVADAAEAASQADIISCATLATTPILHGAWVRPGTHVDLVGAFRRNMREADAALLARASVFVDTLVGAETEAGDIVQAQAEGAIPTEHVRGDLHALCRQQIDGRTRDDEITVFKSVGAALEDLAAAILVMERHSAS